MSLRTIFLDELNVMAKKQDRGFAAKLREVMVDRHPATLDPDEFDPVATVALAWKEVAPRGRVSFEGFAEEMIDGMERARVQAKPKACDWPLAHATCRLLRMVPEEIMDEDWRGRCVRKLSGLVADRQDFMALVADSHPEPKTLWTDAFRLYLAWHPQEPVWLETLWQTALNDTDWLPDEGACQLLEDAAARDPDFISMDRLAAFWKVVLLRSADLADMRRWFYAVGAILEDSPDGMTRLNGIFENFGGHLQDFRLGEKGLPWDLFVEAVAAMFRNPTKRQTVLDSKSAPRAPESARANNKQISPIYKAERNTIQSRLINSLLNNNRELQAA